MKDLHNRLFNWIRKENLPQRELPKEKKYYFREIAVGWKILGMKCNFKEEVDVEGLLKKIDDPLKPIFRKQVEMNLIDDLALNKLLLKEELSARYPVIKTISLKFVDYVCIAENTRWIIERKKVLNFEAIGQVNVYSYLFSKDHPGFPIKKAVICEESSPLLEDYCKEFDITVFQV